MSDLPRPGGPSDPQLRATGGQAGFVSAEVATEHARLIEAGVYADWSSASDRGLVVLAMGLPCWFFPAEGGVGLFVEPGHAPAVREQLDCFERENANWPPGPVQEETRVDGAASLLAAVVVGAVFAAAHGSSAASEGLVRELGRLDAVAVLVHGQGWRVVTSLTLHADGAHLASNLVAAAFFGHFVARRFGLGLGWLLIVACGALGNLATAAIFLGPGHLSVGASTAVFAALGLLGGTSVRPGTADVGGGWTFRRVVPFLAAVVLLGLLGAGQARTDVVAHLAGFGVGVLAGLLLARRKSRARRGPMQRLAAVLAIALVAASWAWALMQVRG